MVITFESKNCNHIRGRNSDHIEAKMVTRDRCTPRHSVSEVSLNSSAARDGNVIDNTGCIDLIVRWESLWNCRRDTLETSSALPPEG